MVWNQLLGVGLLVTVPGGSRAGSLSGVSILSYSNSVPLLSRRAPSFKVSCTDFGGLSGWSGPLFAMVFGIAQICRIVGGTVDR